MTYANKKEKKRLPPARRTEGNSYESILTTGGTRTTGAEVTEATCKVTAAPRGKQKLLCVNPSDGQCGGRG